MEKLFRLKEHGTTAKIEIIGGLTTFLAMAYIIVVNPIYLGSTGMPTAGVAVATCLSAAIGCFLTAFLSNTPFAQAPGMGLNTFFAFTVCGAMGYTWQQALGVVLVSGILFLLITITPLRGKIISSIPAVLKAAISAGIGLFIAFIGFLGSGSGIITLVPDANVTSLNLFAGGVINKTALLTVIGVLLIAVLMAYNVKGAIFIGIIACTIIGIPMGVTNISGLNFSIADISFETFFQIDFSGIFANGMSALLPFLTAVISFLVVDMFDTVGTLLGTAGNNGMLDENGNLPGGDRALIADAIATICGALMGTSTVTTYVESSTGISEGARTGLSSFTVGVLFLISTVFAPIVSIVPGAATAPALIIVGVLMMGSATKIDWTNIENAVPAFLTIVMMPFAYSISEGIGFGFISYTLIKICRGKAKEVPALLYVLSGVFLLMYALKIFVGV